ncbi:DUF58 domain-containing protein [Paenibacillus sp. SC116]|uniref:DUF58 domain-containing protein n=1 Tax=Paenibacillus sp. SC116 TaxID=2968986 RepID=UPI00215AE579|nr:DUF58 domain-containing protein [Paenibacillus sp. SC116]MCR8846539.1 DUF58 domain-containing protein [Paenibacillus sp. SC116]
MKPQLLQLRSERSKQQDRHQQLRLKQPPPRLKRSMPNPLQAIGTDLGAEWLRPTAAGLLALVLLIWGIAERHGALSFMGAALLGYWLFAACSCLTAPLRHIQAATTRCGRKIGPVETELVWTTTITSRSRLPRIWLQVTEVWLRVDEQGEVLDQLSSTRMLYPGSQRRLTCKMSLPAVTLGIYRHGGTHIATGDLLGWWRRGRLIPPSEQVSDIQLRKHSDSTSEPHAVGQKTIEISHAIVVPSAAQWDSNDGLQQLLVQMLRQRNPSQGMMVSMELRPYQKGDAWRSIQWRNYAKSRQLVVRPHQAEEENDMIILFDDSSVQGNQLSKDAFAALIDTTIEWVWRLEKSGYRGRIQLFRTLTETWIRGYESIIFHLAAGRRLGEEGTSIGYTVQSPSEAQQYISAQSSVIVISPYDATSRLASIQSHYQISSIPCWIQASTHPKKPVPDLEPKLESQTVATAQHSSERMSIGSPLNKHAGGSDDVTLHN